MTVKEKQTRSIYEASNATFKRAALPVPCRIRFLKVVFLLVFYNVFCIGAVTEQLRFKMAPEASKIGQNGGQDGPCWRQDAPKMLQDGAKMAHVGA